MSVRNYVPIDVDDLPEQFDYEIDDIDYIFEIKYNEQGDFFTAGIALDDGTWIVRDWKMILNQTLFFNISDERLPTTDLTPMDESGQASEISITNFGDTVFLYEDTVDEDSDPSEQIPIDSDEIGDD